MEIGVPVAGKVETRQLHLRLCAVFGASKIAAYLNERTVADIPLRDLKIVHDWSGYYYEGTVYSDAEEEKMIRDQYNIHT